jgi:hypothetical protein
MNTTFSYSVLKYRHSILLNEILNVGLLFYFPEDKRILFSFPTKLNRISHLYQNINIATIKTVQAIFTSHCSRLNREWDFTANSLFKDVIEVERPFKKLINEIFLVEDASSLYFEDIKTGINVGLKETISYYEKEYFSCYEDILINPNKKDEKYIEHKLKSTLRQTLKDNQFSVYDISIDKNIKTGLVSERFKYGWKNGGDKLISLIGFDLVEAESIQKKAYEWYGKLSFLKDYAKENNTEFHLLTSKPTSKKLFKSYDSALNVINAAEAPSKIYEDSEIEKYSEYLADHITGKVKSI